MFWIMTPEEYWTQPCHTNRLSKTSPKASARNTSVSSAIGRGARSTCAATTPVVTNTPIQGWSAAALHTHTNQPI